MAPAHRAVYNLKVMSITPDLYDRYEESLRLYAKSLATMSIRLSPQRAACEVLEVLRHAHVRLYGDDLTQVILQYREMVEGFKKAADLPVATSASWVRSPWRDSSALRG